MPMFVAVDVGGTKTLVAVFDKGGKIIEEQKFPTPADYNDFKIELADTVAKLATKVFSRVVMAIPGRLDRKHGVAIAFGNLSWVNVPVQADAERVFNTPVIIENDSKLAALSEAVLVKKQYKKV